MSFEVHCSCQMLVTLYVHGDSWWWLLGSVLRYVYAISANIEYLYIIDVICFKSCIFKSVYDNCICWTKFSKSHDVIMWDHAEARATLATWIPSFLWTACDANFELMVSGYAKVTNNMCSTKKIWYFWGLHPVMDLKLTTV